MTTKTVFLSGTVLFVPSDFDSTGPWTLGGLGGGGGAHKGNSQSSAGGGAGAYAQITNADVALKVGGTVFLSVGTAGVGATTSGFDGTAGTDTWVNVAGANSAPATSAAGFLAKAGAGSTAAASGAGGLASASVGSTKFDGGSGGTGNNGVARGGGGGGGAGGPNGPGGAGGATALGAGGGSGGGGSGGGGSGSGGAAGGSSSGATGVSGGANSAGAGAGVAPGGNGSLGGGGAGADRAVTPGAGGNGGAGVDWTQTSDGTTAGPGGGGGGGGNASGANTGGNGGAAGGYGAGGGGCGGSTSGTSASGNGGNGSAGFVLFTYTVNPNAGGGGGRASAPFTLNFALGGGLGSSPGSVGVAMGSSSPGSATFSPDQISGLTFAIRSDIGVTAVAGSIVGVAPAWNTSIGVFGSGSNAPTQAAAFGPGGQDLFQFTSSSTQFFSLASDVTVGACTVIWMGAPTIFNANKQLFANASNSSFLRTLTGGAGSAITTMAVLTVGGGVTNIPLASAVRPYRNMLPMAMTYDPAAASGTASIYVDNIFSGNATGVGAGGFLFNRIGVIGASTNPYDGYMGPILIYNRILTAEEMAAVTTYLATWRGQNIYIAAAGSDSSVTPWNSTTPFQTPTAAAAQPYLGFETLAPKGGDKFRLAAQALCPIPGLSPTVRMTWDGSVWGTGKALILGSTAPTLTVTSGTIYDCGVFASIPMTYVMYVPGGTITFGANYTLGNMQRLTQTVGTQSAPGVGQWGFDTGTNHVYVNAGVALTTGDIEVALASGSGRLASLGDNWSARNYVVAITQNTCCSPPGNNIVIDGVEAYFGNNDGIDQGPGQQNVVVKNCVVAYMGDGPAGTGGSQGDSYSAHQGTQVTRTLCQAWWSDKGGFNDGVDCTVINDRCISVGSLVYRNTSGTGAPASMTLTNCLGVVAANAFSDDCVTAGSATAQVTVENCTLVSLKGTGSGINQVLAGGSITALNNIITGFVTGLNWQGPGTLVAGYNDYYANTTNYSGTGPAPHDLAVNPLFVNAAAFNYVLAGNSPCLGAGVFIPGIVIDLAGTTRPNPPSVGAYE